MNLVSVFGDTIKKYRTAYKDATDELVNNGTFVHKPGSLSFDKQPFTGTIKLIDLDTVSAGIQYAHLNKYNTAVLNFADAETPGGLVTIGASTQEECICRCSNLYASLTTPYCREQYYDYNKRNYNNGKNTDAVIYSEGVTCFKNARYELLDREVCFDVITCPAPRTPMSEKEAMKTYIPRIKMIVFSAIEHNAKNLILGAWGCGAFGQNPFVVAQAFLKVIEDYGGYFENIIFAIPDSGVDGNFAVFQDVLFRSSVS